MLSQILNLKALTEVKIKIYNFGLDFPLSLILDRELKEYNKSYRLKLTSASQIV